MNIRDIFHYPNYVEETVQGHPLLISSEKIGIEIELEKVGVTPRFKYWEVVSDGSLRNGGQEFIFRGPLGGLDLFKALAEASKFFYSTKPEASWRCSTHVHINVRNMSVSQLRNLIVAYTVLEEVMFKCGGEERYKNNFCPAYGFAQDQLMTLSRHWNKSDSDFVLSAVNTWSKYTALNLLPMSTKGSVELRISKAVISSGGLLRLANRILLLKKIAMEWVGTPEELANHLVSLDVQKLFTKKLAGEAFDSLVQEDVERGYMNAMDIIHLQNPANRMMATGVVATTLTADSARALVDVLLACDEGDLGLQLHEYITQEGHSTMPSDLLTEVCEFINAPQSYFLAPENSSQ